MGNAVIWSVGENLISPEFSFLETASDEHGSLFGVDLNGVLIGLLDGKAKQPLQHFDNVVVAVVVVIQQDNVVKWSCFVLILALVADFRYGGRLSHRSNRACSGCRRDNAGTYDKARVLRT